MILTRKIRIMADEIRSDGDRWRGYFNDDCTFAHICMGMFTD